MADFVCSNCGYSFEANKASSCPWCNSKNVGKAKNAEELVNEVEVE